MNPFISFCLYVAARVFVQYLKSRPEDTQIADSLRFLLTAMNALKAKNPLTESFLVQLDVDLESLGLRNPKFKSFVQGLANLENNPNNYSYATRSVRGPDGRIDQCNFIKIVDNDDSPGEAPGLDGNWLGGTNLPNGEVHPAGMQGVLQGLSQENTGLLFDNTASGHSQMSSFGQSSSSNNVDLDLSSDQNHSDRPTPSSSTASSLQPGQNQQGRPHSGRSSFDASPASSHQPGDPTRAANAFFNHTPDFANVGPTGMTPGSTFSLPATPRDFTVSNGWEMSNQGLTPVGEGVFQQLMGMGPMDMAWDGTS